MMQVSGDNFSFQMLDNGSCIMSVSDGMGSGYAACKESEMVIDLIEKFMEAGFFAGYCPSHDEFCHGDTRGK